MKSAGKARNNGIYRHIRTSKEIIRNLLNDFANNFILLTVVTCLYISFGFIFIQMIIILALSLQHLLSNSLPSNNFSYHYFIIIPQFK